jgi:hypothetical protein
MDMKPLLIAIGLAVAIGAGLFFNVPQKLLSRFPTIRKNIPKSIALPSSITKTSPTSSVSGKVAGVSTESNEEQNPIIQKGIEVGKSLSTVFLSSSDSKTQTIEVEKIVNQVSKQVESIPSNLLEQAKVEYCKAVLQNATASARP